MENQENTASAVETKNKEQRVYGGHDATTGAGAFFNRNKKLLSYAGIIIIVAIVGIIGYRMYAQSQNKDAKVEIFKAQRLWEADSFRMALQGDPSISATGMIDVADAYGVTETGNLAEYYIGVANYHQGQYEEAIDHLKKFDSDSKMVMPLALGLIGDSYSQLKNYEEAASYYRKAAEHNENEFTTPMYYKKAGLVYEELKQPEKALDVYKIIKDKYKLSRQGNDIEKYIARVEFATQAQ